MKNVRRTRKVVSKCGSQIATDAKSVAASRPLFARSGSHAAIVTDEHKRVVLDWLTTGRGIAALLRLYPDLPGLTALAKARKADPQFDADWTAARAIGLEATMDEAGDYAYSCRGDKALAIAAGRYFETVQRMAVSLAPKTYGPMLKHAGHDGEALIIQTVNYKDLPATDGGKLIEVIDNTKLNDDSK